MRLRRTERFNTIIRMAILYTYPLILGGVGLMVFAGLRSVVSPPWIRTRPGNRADRRRDDRAVFRLSAFHLGFVVYALSFGVALSGLATCLAIIIPMLRGLSPARPPER